MYQKTTLDNGLRIITKTMPHIHSACIAFFVGTGSRYESEKESGVSHFIEHMCFKGTMRRKTAREISAAIEGIGGMLNGGTDRELTVYWCKVPHAHLSTATDVLADMLLHSMFDPREIERERQVIIEEVNMGIDSPSQQVGMLIDKLIWPNQAMGRDVAGTKETVAALSGQTMLAYLARQYSPKNSVVSVAGNVSHEEVVSELDQVLGDWTSGSPQPCPPADNRQDTPRINIEARDTEQVHLCLAVRGLPTEHPHRFTLDLLNTILGEGMSSRLFTEIREKRGLAYTIHSYAEHFSDSGSIIIYAGMDPRHIDTAVTAILQEMRHLKEKVPGPELAQAKEFVKGRLLLRMEDNRSVSSWAGGQELLLGHIRTVDEVTSIINAISAEDLQEVAQELFLTDKLSLSTVGPISDEDKLLKLLEL